LKQSFLRLLNAFFAAICSLIWLGLYYSFIIHQPLVFHYIFAIYIFGIIITIAFGHHKSVTRELSVCTNPAAYINIIGICAFGASNIMLFNAYKKLYDADPHPTYILILIMPIILIFFVTKNRLCKSKCTSLYQMIHNKFFSSNNLQQHR